MTYPFSAALAAAGATAAQFLELDASDLDAVRRCVPEPVYALALLVLEMDAEFSARWQAAGTDWNERGRVLHDAVLWVLTPDVAEAVAS